MRVLKCPLKFAVWIFPLVLAWANGGRALAQTEICNEIQHDQISLRNFHQNKAFNMTRSLDGGYSYDLGPQFLPALHALGPQDVWFDSGGGEGNAVTDYWNLRNKKPLAQILMVSYRTKLESRPGLRVLKGRLLEEIPLSELGQVSLISDDYGPFAYASQPQRVIWTYLKILKIGGKAFIASYLAEMLEETRILYPDGSSRTLLDELRSIPEIGVQVEQTDRGRRALVVTKLAEIDWMPPEWRLLFHSRNAPPVRILAGPGWTPDSVGAERDAWVAQVPASRVGDWFGSRSSKAPLLLQYSSWRTAGFERLLIQNRPRVWMHVKGTSKMSAEYQLATESYRRNRLSWSGQMAKKLKGWGGRPGARIEKFPELVTWDGKSEGTAPRSVGLITDLEDSWMINSGRPDVILDQYLDWLTDDGVIVLSLGVVQGASRLGSRVAQSTSTGAEGKQISFFSWLSDNPGLRVKICDWGSGLVEIRIANRSNIRRRKLTFLGPLQSNAPASGLRSAVFLQD